jgi:maltooligosyltrehalose trehalohydrolase
LLSFEALKLVAAAVLLSPFLPLIFMGEEYGEPAPFLYFTSHGDPGLGTAVHEGRRSMFAALPTDTPDPQLPDTFRNSQLDWSLRRSGNHATLLAYYRKLLQLRRELPPQPAFDPGGEETAFSEEQRIITLLRRGEAEDFFLALHLAPRDAGRPTVLPPGEWAKELDSSEERWLGPGSNLPWLVSTSADHTLHLPGHAAVLYRRRRPPTVE